MAASSELSRRHLLGLLPLGLAGCLTPEQIARIEGPPGSEGTGIMGSRALEVIRILASYEATPKQVDVATERAREIKQVLVQPKAKVKQETRVIAIETEPDERATGETSVVLWDTETEQVLGNKVYDIGKPPKPGKVVTWDTLTVQYMGRATAL